MPPTVLITGASKRIGKAIALGMAKDGYTILLHYSTSVARAQETAEEIRNMGGLCHLLQADLSEHTQIKALIQQAFETASECQHLINNAAIFKAGTLRETTEALFDEHLLTNLKAPVFLTQHFAKRCLGEGLVINLLDTRIRNHATTHFAYSLSKKMLYEFTRMAAKELAPQIRVNGICPGLILPPQDKDETYLAQKSETIPLKKFGDLADIVQAVRFLRDNPFITGDCLFLDGGEHLG